MSTAPVFNIQYLSSPNYWPHFRRLSLICVVFVPAPVDSVLCEAVAAIGSVSEALLPKSVIPQLLATLQMAVNEGKTPSQMQVIYIGFQRFSSVSSIQLFYF